MKVMECGFRWAVEARRQGRDEQQEQEESKQGKQVRFGEEQQLGKTGGENAGEPEVMGRTTEVPGGREQQERQREINVTEEKANMKAKEEDLAAKDSSRA